MIHDDNLWVERWKNQKHEISNFLAIQNSGEYLIIFLWEAYSLHYEHGTVSAIGLAGWWLSLFQGIGFPTTWTSV